MERDRAEDALFDPGVVPTRLRQRFSTNALAVMDAWHIIRSSRRLAKIREALRAWSTSKKLLLPENLSYAEGMPGGDVDWGDLDRQTTGFLRYERKDLHDEVTKEFGALLDFNDEVRTLAAEAADLMALTRTLLDRTQAFRAKLQALGPSPNPLRLLRENLDAAVVLRIAESVGAPKPDRTDLGAIEVGVENRPLSEHRNQAVTLLDRLSKRHADAQAESIRERLEGLLTSAAHGPGMTASMCPPGEQESSPATLAARNDRPAGEDGATRKMPSATGNESLVESTLRAGTTLD